MTLLSEIVDHSQAEGESTSHNSKVQCVTTNFVKPWNHLRLLGPLSIRNVKFCKEKQITVFQIHLGEINLSFF